MLSLKAMQPYGERLAEKYLSDEVKIGFDAFLTLVSECCLSIRHLESFLKSSKSVKDLQKAKQKKFFATWQEAAEVVRKAGVKSVLDYRDRYRRLDARLPSSPGSYYEDFPGWPIFLKKIVKKFYETWQEASSVARRHGMFNYRDYKSKYAEIDSMLPSCPERVYGDFPGWVKFLSNSGDKKLLSREREFFSTWQEASEVVIRANVESSTEYVRRYITIDARLPACPYAKYKDFPGWKVFLGRAKHFESSSPARQMYKTWQEAAEVARKAGVKSCKVYRGRYFSIDNRLPSSPGQKYGNFPGWYVFLGKPVKLFCETWQEAAEVARKAGVSSSNDYRMRYSCISDRLPVAPHYFYDDWPGWYVFLGKSKKKYM